MSSAANAPKRVLILQGGGALGSYQAGVYEALAGADILPDWVCGISIGAVNAALIAGNPPERRLERLREFWEMTSAGLAFMPTPANHTLRSVFNEASAAWIAAMGIPGFFTPRLISPFLWPAGSAEAMSFYDTTPLRNTLERLVDFDLINAKKVRFGVGAVNIRTGRLRFFDNARETIGPEHVMASGALPPGLPPVEIDGEAYWDGGLVSNTPLDHVLDKGRHDDLVIFQVDLFNSEGEVPRNILESTEREKEIRFASRTRRNTAAQLQLRRARKAIRDLVAKLPEDLLDDPEIKVLNAFARENAVSIVQLIYRGAAYESGSKDYEFSRATMNDHWAAGLTDGQKAAKNRQKIEAVAPGASRLYDATARGDPPSATDHDDDLLNPAEGSLP
jgi:NTE family protein